MKKLFSLLTLALLTMSAWAANTYVKVEATNDLTSGNYLIVNETAGVAFDGSLTNLDVSSNTISVTITDGVIAADVTTNAAVFTIDIEAGTIKSASGFYIGRNADSNGLNTTNNPETYTNSISIDENGDAVIAGTHTTLRYNKASDQNRFRYYKSGQEAIQLYKFVGDEPVITVAAPTLPAACTFSDSYTVEITNNEADATVYYSTDGLVWTAGNTVTINETTTVYAKATLNGVDSKVVSETYTKVEPVTGSNTYVRVTKADQIAAGNKYIVVCETKKAFMGAINTYGASVTTTTGNAPLTITDGIANIYGAEVVELTLGGEADAWTFTTDDKYICWNSGNSLNVADTISDGAKWKIINTPNGYVLTNVSDSTRVLRYNSSSPRFACYTSTQTPAVIFVQDDDPDPIVPQNDEVETLDEANKLQDGESFTFTGNAVVTYRNGKYMFLRDNSGYGLIYETINGTINNGDVLKSGWKANKTTYNGLIEYTGATGVSTSGITNTELSAPQEITALSEDMINAYVEIKNVTSISGTTATLADGTTITLYNRFNVTIPEFENDNYTIKGIVSIHNENLQLYFIEAVGYVPEVYDVNSIAEAIALKDGSKFTMFNDVVVTYQNGSRLFIRDTDNGSGLIFGADGTFENGQVLSDGWTATYQLFNGNTPEFTNPEGVEADGDETRDASPFERTTITAENVNEYVILKGVTLQADTTDTGIFYTAEGLQICNFFNGVEIPAVEEGKTYDVTGIVMISKAGVVRVYITEMTEAAAPAGLRGDVNDDKTVNISDVTALIDFLLNPATSINQANANVNLDEAINISDVTALIDFLLSGSWPANE